MNVFQRAQDAYATLCNLYGEGAAPLIMKIRGACDPNVARLARAIGKSLAAVRAALDYRILSGLPGGYRKLMTASRHDGSVKRLVDQAGAGRNFRPWEVDTAVQVVLAVVDAGGGGL